jgi:6-phosphogluconolactonase
MEAATGNKPNVEVVTGADDLARRALEFFVSGAEAAVKARGRFLAALSGGQTPRRFFELLGLDPASLGLRWEAIHLFWVDERCVPVDSPMSNYRLAADTFLSSVPIPPENVHRIPADCGDFKAAAGSYEETIKAVFGLPGGRLPEFDLIVLGMGADGHTGSLLANSYAPFDFENIACVVYVLDDGVNRITLTPPVLRAAARLVVLVCGGEKAETLKAVLTGPQDEIRYPIHVLWPVLEKITWLVDREAARLL